MNRETGEEKLYAWQYFGGYTDKTKVHPCFSASGTKDHCELCGEYCNHSIHQKPYDKPEPKP